MLLKFINRKPELNALEKRYKSPHPEFFIIYGRRRIGKTELAKELTSDKKHFYFLAREEPIELEIEAEAVIIPPMVQQLIRPSL